MCTRILQDIDIAVLQRHYRIQTEYHYPPPNRLPPPYPGRVISGRMTALVCATGADGLPELGQMEWGFVPAGARDGDFGPLNARSETVASKPMFCTALRRRRCIVPVSVWYEFGPGPEGGRRIPWRIDRADGQPAHLAAIWNRWRGHEGPTSTLAVLTTRPLPRLARIHDRMPVVLPTPEACLAWLDRKTSVEQANELARGNGDDVYRLSATTRIGG